MTETLITFPVAKIAKEKGFNWETIYWFEKHREEWISHSCFEGYELSPCNNNVSNKTISQPTQSLLQKWLREKHNINVESNYLSNIQTYRCIFKPMNIIPKSFKTRADFDNAVYKYYGKINYDRYEEALEAGLIEGLKHIK